MFIVQVQCNQDISEW